MSTIDKALKMVQKLQSEPKWFAKAYITSAYGHDLTTEQLESILNNL